MHLLSWNGKIYFGCWCTYYLVGGSIKVYPLLIFSLGHKRPHALLRLQADLGSQLALPQFEMIASAVTQ